MNAGTAEPLMDHLRSPYHRDRLRDATHAAQAVNPLCGDQVELQLRLSADGFVTAAYFLGQGCVVSQASASILCERIEGMSVSDLHTLIAESVLGMVGVQLSPIRQRCALLAFEALSKILGAAAVQSDSGPYEASSPS